MEETISLKEIVETLKKRLWLIVSLVVCAAIIAGVVSYYVITPTYEASSQFIVNQENQEQGANYDVNEIRSNVEIINTYNVIIKSPAILDPVTDELGLSISSGQLKGKIQVSSAENSQVVTVTASDADPNVAADIANTTVKTFQDEIPDLMNVNNVNILSEAAVSSSPQQVSPKPMLNIAIAIVLGAMVGVGIAFLLEYMDNTLKNEYDIEEKLELPLMGVVSHMNDDDVASSPNHQPVQRKGGSSFGKKKKTS